MPYLCVLQVLKVNVYGMKGVVYGMKGVVYGMKGKRLWDERCK